VPYFGGTILRSQYYIVGGITEVNYNIQSGGFDAAVNLVGGRARTYTMNIGVDLRIIDTRTLVVVKTVSMQKQIRGQEVGAGIYRFFNDYLLDFNIGSKNQEPLQLGVRTTIEQSVLELIAAVTGVDAGYCINRALDSKFGSTPAKPLTPEEQLLRAIYGEPVPGGEATTAPAPKTNGAKTNGEGKGAPMVDQDTTQSGLVPQNAGNAGRGGGEDVLFDFASAAISTQALSQIEKMAVAASQGNSVTFKLIGRDSEIFPPMQRRELTNQRVKAITDALAARGVQASRVGVTWLPEPTDASITRLGSGYQQLAILVIAK
jgi:outer membrane protein OmpA-like peptidoglycan-associated protein